jgi:hypothetical protein
MSICQYIVPLVQLQQKKLSQMLNYSLFESFVRDSVRFENGSKLVL